MTLVCMYLCMYDYSVIIYHFACNFSPFCHRISAKRLKLYRNFSRNFACNNDKNAESWSDGIATYLQLENTVYV